MGQQAVVNSLCLWSYSSCTVREELLQLIYLVIKEMPENHE